MASSHTRAASNADRRSVNAAAQPSRAASLRARDYEKPFVRDDGSPVPPEPQGNDFATERAFDKTRRQTNDFERKIERTFTTTKEKVIRTRSPVKESVSAGNRGEPDRTRRAVQSPVIRKKEKETEEGKGQFRKQARSNADFVCT